VKDVETNAEEKGEKFRVKIQEKRFCSFREFGLWLKLRSGYEEKNSPV
jgi:hypothetical protein